MTRPTDRIDDFLAKVGDYWRQAPDLRFGQLIINVLGFADRDPFFLEENEMLELFDTYFSPSKRAAYENNLTKRMARQNAQNGPQNASESDSEAEVVPDVENKQLIKARQLLRKLQVNDSLENANALCELIRMFF